MKKTILVGIGIWCLALAAQAQVTYGFKVGLNFSSLQGDKETDALSNETIESFGYLTGFHVGGAIGYKLTDEFTLGTEILFSQKGGRTKLNGNGYNIYRKADSKLISYGKQDQSLNITNSYIDVPLMAYYKIGSVQLSGGLNAGFLVLSKASGESRFNGLSPNGTTLPEVVTSLTYNYLSDGAAEAASEKTQTLGIDGEIINIPTERGAYYNLDTKEGALFNRIDVGVNAGISFFFNDALFLGARLNYGLSDVTNKKVDYSRTTITNGQPVLRDDKDRNVSIQLSLGFSF